MRDMPPEQTVLACVPGAIPAAERGAHFALAKQLFSQLAEKREALHDGYAFRFAPSALGSIAVFIENERKCCPFMNFHISLPSSGELWLRMTRPSGTREVLATEYVRSNQSRVESAGTSASRTSRKRSSLPS